MNTIDKLQEELETLRKSYDEAMERIKDNEFKNLFKEAFEANPRLQAFTWTQYIPGFNDGDPCVFSVGEVGYLIQDDPVTIDDFPSGSNVYDSDLEWVETYLFNNRKWDSETRSYIELPFKNTDKPSFCEDALKLTRFLEGNSELLEKIFGSNAWILVTRENIYSEDYDCGY